jgi:Gas vesicle synthesis protein GvpO
VADTRQARHPRSTEETGPRVRRPRSSAVEVAQRARRELAEITALEPERVISLEPRDDGTWTMTVEMLELHRIPETDDMLGTYEMVIAASGEVLCYRRIRRYPRSLAFQEVGSR